MHGRGGAGSQGRCRGVTTLASARGARRSVQQHQRVVTDEGRSERLAGGEQACPEGVRGLGAQEREVASLALAQDRDDVCVAGVGANRANRQVAWQAGCGEQSRRAGADDADQRQRCADVAVRQVAAVTSASDRRLRRERGVGADKQGPARVDAQVPDTAQPSAAADRRRRIAEAIDQGAVEQLAVAAQLERAVVGAVGEPELFMQTAISPGTEP